MPDRETSGTAAGSDVRVEPLTPPRLVDFASLCAAMGPNRSCWCMYWRHRPGERPAPNRQAARALVEGAPVPPGLVAYREGLPVGWVAVAPRAEYPRLNAGRDTAPLDERAGAWAVPCFFVVQHARGTGVARALLRAAVAFARSHGARAVEGVPGDPGTRARTPTASYTGTTAMFAAQGFVEVARRTPRGRVLMRLDLG